MPKSFWTSAFWPFLMFMGSCGFCLDTLAAEGPFLITYTQMEEPGNLEITTKNVTGKLEWSTNVIHSVHSAIIARRPPG